MDWLDQRDPFYRVFFCVAKCGVRQGDPLSPLLFVIAADLLQSVINQMLTQGVLSLPIPTHDQEFPIIQYADDTVIFLSARDEELVALKNMLSPFNNLLVSRSILQSPQ